MVKTVQCVTKGCDHEGQVFPVSTLFIARVAPLKGPFKCPHCGEPMKIVEHYPANKGKSGKTTSRTTSQPTDKKVGKRRVKKGVKIKRGKTVTTRFKKPSSKPGARKRGPSK